MSAAGPEFLFITSALLVNVGGRVTAFGASARLGSIAPALALGQLGYDARAFSVSYPDAVEQAARGAKRIVFGEMFETQEGWTRTVALYRRLLEGIGEKGSRVIFSIADDHFDEEDFAGFYREALRDCLAVTVVSEGLAQTVRQFTSRPVIIVPEAAEGSRGAPQAIAARKVSPLLTWLGRRIGLSMDHWRVRLLWFGYPQNLPPLLELVPALERYAQRFPLLLTCITRPVVEMQQLMTPARTREDSRFRVHFAPWSPLAMDPAIAASDVILIPSDYRQSAKRAKSPNRLVSGLHGGRFVVAHPLPAYEPYAGFAWVGEDLCAGLDWAIQHPREVVERITRGQAHIDARHSSEVIARFWLDVFHPKAAS